MYKYNLTLNSEYKKNQNMTYRSPKNAKWEVDALAIVGKNAIEHTKLHPYAKASINLGIDIAAELLKQEALSDIEKLCIAAKSFDIERVVIIPLGCYNGNDIVAIRAYGEKTEAFFKHLGLLFIPENIQNNFLGYINEAEKKFCAVLYEKKN